MEESESLHSLSALRAYLSLIVLWSPIYAALLAPVIVLEKRGRAAVNARQEAGRLQGPSAPHRYLDSR